MMTFIEGVGDEVIYFVGFAILVIILALAWNSTSVSTVNDRGSISENALFRTAFLLIERRRRSSNNNNTNVSVGVINNNTEARNRPNNVVTNLRTSELRTARSRIEEVEIPTANQSTQATTSGSASVSTAPDTPLDSGPGGSDESLVIQSNDLESILQARDQSELRLRNVNIPHSPETPTFLEKVAIPTEVISDSVNEESAQSEDALADGHIRVRLKFLNDTQRLVDARLFDQLGQFKQQHFGEELGHNKIVRLIFNGQLLQRDQETLQFHGLFDNCVVHCHISSTNISPPAPVFSPQVELDLSRLMLPLFGLILGLIWCCRIQYRQYFSGTSTFALLCITGFFALSVIAIWLPTRNRQVRG